MRTGRAVIRTIALRPEHWVASTQWHAVREAPGAMPTLKVGMFPSDSAERGSLRIESGQHRYGPAFTDNKILALLELRRAIVDNLRNEVDSSVRGRWA